MTRVAATVFLVNTFLPVLVVSALIWAGWQSYRAYVDLLHAPVAAAMDRLGEVQGAFDDARQRIVETRDVIAAKAADVEREVAAATAPMRAVGAAVGAVADAALSFQVKKPVITWRPIYLPGKKRRTLKFGKFEPKFVHVALVDDKFRLTMPQPVRDAFDKLGEGFSKMVAFTEPMAEIVDAVRGLSPDLAPLQAKLAEAERDLRTAQVAFGKALGALEPIVQVVTWGAYLLGPWIVLSYVCWVWLRLVRWRALMAGKLG